MAMAVGASPLLYAVECPCSSSSLVGAQAQVSSLVKFGVSRRGSYACGAARGARAMAPEDEKMTRRSPLDFPIEWDRPRPGRRADIFPQFSPMKTPLPPPLPADPPEEDEDEEEKKEGEEEENPDEPEKPDVSF
ncbi:hypothetical protein M758_8G026300 [Ceratodon purpureus]|uniref:Uncharacterized protein n=1 Tax=Ceratodon purpureus TaxID=3225 RepID=A0A8T0GUL8_CERPU|nr:hypothetical protein KC19_8G025900 [Ceratodon purpureus]KAG0607415.1 hypothetical protein M758_8G026300 [Ceratodon purpureus]